MKGSVQEGKLLIKPLKQERKIIRPNTLYGEQKSGIVELSGGEEVSAGDTVHYTALGNNVRVDGVDYVLLNEKSVLYYE